MQLKPVSEDDAEFLYNSLKEREGRVNISHKLLPTWEEHIEFVKNYDYITWDIIIVDEEKIGNVYLTQLNEIGIFILKKFHDVGYGEDILQISIQLITNQFNFLENMVFHIFKIRIQKQSISS